MIRKQDVLAFAAFCTIAAVVALAAYLLMNQPAQEQAALPLDDPTPSHTRESAAADTGTTNDQAEVIVDVATLRLGPSVDAERVGSLLRGEVVTVVGGSAAGGWYRISRGGSQSDNMDAWVAAEFLAFVTPTAVPAATEVLVATHPPLTTPVPQGPTAHVVQPQATEPPPQAGKSVATNTLIPISTPSPPATVQATGPAPPATWTNTPPMGGPISPTVGTETPPSVTPTATLLIPATPTPSATLVHVQSPTPSATLVFPPTSSPTPPSPPTPTPSSTPTLVPPPTPSDTPPPVTAIPQPPSGTPPTPLPVSP